MIITCNNCNKNFDIDSSLIPEKGRLLQCNACNHKWFFKKEIIDRPIPIVKVIKPSVEPEILNEEIVLAGTKIPKTIELLDRVTRDVSTIEKISKKMKTEQKVIKKEDKNIKIKKSKSKKNYNTLNLTIIFIISFIALMFVLDTFKVPISKIYPNIEHILYSLYETINDIWLFFIDLI